MSIAAGSSLRAMRPPAASLVTMARRPWSWRVRRIPDESSRKQSEEWRAMPVEDPPS